MARQRRRRLLVDVVGDGQGVIAVVALGRLPREEAVERVHRHLDLVRPRVQVVGRVEVEVDHVVAERG